MIGAGSGLRTRRTVGALLVLAVTTVVVGGLVHLRTDTGPESFLPAGDPALAGLIDSAASFGGDPVLVLMESPVEHGLLSAKQLPLLLKLEGQLAQLPDVAVVYGPATVVNQVAGASQNLLATLAGRRDATETAAREEATKAGASPRAAKAAADEALATFDDRYGALLVRGLPAGLPTLRNETFVNHVIFDDAAVPRPQWQFVVPRADTISILVRPREGLDQAGTENLVERVTDAVDGAGLTTKRVTVTGVPVITADLGQEVRKETPLLGGLAVLLIAGCYLVIPWTPKRRHRLLPLAMTLCATAVVLSVFGWVGRPVSLGVVAFLPILVGIASDYPAYLTHAINRRTAVVAALASASAFAALAASSVPFVRDLGVALAAGLLTSLVIGLVVHRGRARQGGAAAEPAPAPTDASTEASTGTRTSTGRPFGSRAAAWGLLVALGAVALAGWVALPRLHIEAQPEVLAHGVPALDGIKHAEDVLGGSGEVQVELRGPDVLSQEALAWMRQTEEALAVEQGGDLKPVVSPASLLQFLGSSPTDEQIRAGTDLMPEYLTSSVVRSDRLRATMSYVLRLQDLQQQQAILDRMRVTIPVPPPGYDYELVGLPVVAARGYELISGSTYLTNLLGIAVAGTVLLVGLRRRSDALRAVLASLLAIGWGWALIAVLGVSLTPLTLALGSLTTATACEFTVMLGLSDRVLPHVRRTVQAAALAAALGFAALAASRLEMVRDFGLLLAGSVALSYLAAHLVVRLLPARHHDLAATRTSAVTDLAPTPVDDKREVFA